MKSLAGYLLGISQKEDPGRQEDPQTRRTKSSYRVVEISRSLLILLTIFSKAVSTGFLSLLQNSLLPLRFFKKKSGDFQLISSEFSSYASSTCSITSEVAEMTLVNSIFQTPTPLLPAELSSLALTSSLPAGHSPLDDRSPSGRCEIFSKHYLSEKYIILDLTRKL